jgi:hypothetical protein
MGLRWFWGLLTRMLPLTGLALVGLGTFILLRDLHEVSRVSHIRIPMDDYVVPGALVVFGAFALLFCFLDARWDARRAEDDDEASDEATPPSPGSPTKASRLDRLLEARDFLPDEPPEGWTRPLVVSGANRWLFDTKTECIALVVARERRMTAVRVFIAGRGLKEPVSDARCSELLAHIRHVGEFIEADPDKRHPEVRVWIAIPIGHRPRWRVPGTVPPPRERTLSPHLVAARKYLPQKLPAGWSVPIAIGDDHGTGWKDGAWMIGTSDERFIVVFLVTSRGRVKLSVTFFGADGIEVSEGSAAEMLRHFRGVLEFAQTEAVPGEVPTRTYLGEITPEGGARMILN